MKTLKEILFYCLMLVLSFMFPKASPVIVGACLTLNIYRFKQIKNKDKRMVILQNWCAIYGVAPKINHMPVLFKPIDTVNLKHRKCILLLNNEGFVTTGWFDANKSEFFGSNGGTFYPTHYAELPNEPTRY